MKIEYTPYVAMSLKDGISDSWVWPHDPQSKEIHEGFNALLEALLGENRIILKDEFLSETRESGPHGENIIRAVKEKGTENNGRWYLDIDEAIRIFRPYAEKVITEYRAKRLSRLDAALADAEKMDLLPEAEMAKLRRNFAADDPDYPVPYEMGFSDERVENAKKEREDIISALDFLTTKEAAEIIGILPRSVKVLCQREKLPGARKVGRDWLIPRASAEGYEKGPQGFAAHPELAKRHGKKE